MILSILTEVLFINLFSMINIYNYNKKNIIFNFINYTIVSNPYPPTVPLILYNQLAAGYFQVPIFFHK